MKNHDSGREPGARRPVRLGGAVASVAAACVFLAAPVGSQEQHDHSQMDHSVMDHGSMDHGAMDHGTMSGDEHAAHRAMMTSPSYQVTEARYDVPDVTLQDEHGRAVQLRELLSGDRPVAVNFIFTSCTTICPVMTATMLQLQRELTDQDVKPLFVSISIDPDFDTVETLGGYARRFGADWTFLTGNRADVLEVLQSFSAWRGSKNNHAAITLFRSAGGADRWTRIEGLASAKTLSEIWKNSVT
jgi:protein SCO1/2